MATGVQSVADIVEASNHPTNEDILRAMTDYQLFIENGRIPQPAISPRDPVYRVMPVEPVTPTQSVRTVQPVTQSAQVPGFFPKFASVVNWGMANPVPAGVLVVGSWVLLNSRLLRRRLF